MKFIFQITFLQCSIKENLEKTDKGEGGEKRRNLLPYTIPSPADDQCSYLNDFPSEFCRVCILNNFLSFYFHARNPNPSIISPYLQNRYIYIFHQLLQKMMQSPRTEGHCQNHPLLTWNHRCSEKNSPPAPLHLKLPLKLRPL